MNTSPLSILVPGAVAVVTGGAAGIGLAASKRFARLGMRVCIADQGKERLRQAAEEIAALTPDGMGDVMVSETDVSRVDELRTLEAAVRERFGGTDVLMNNAGVQPGSSVFGPVENWDKVMGVNLWGAIHISWRIGRRCRGGMRSMPRRLRRLAESGNVGPCGSSNTTLPCEISHSLVTNRTGDARQVREG